MSSIEKWPEHLKNTLSFTPETGKIVGIEALIRWQHPQKGILTAAKSIPVAEKTGLTHRIDKFVFNNIILQLIHQQKNKSFSIPIAINILSRELFNSDPKDTLTETLDKKGCYLN